MPGQLKRAPKRKWPCGGCSIQCNDDSICCGKCERWFHATCEKLTKEHMKLLQNLPEECVCSFCTKNGESFDFKRGLKRLEDASRAKTLDTAVKLERILLREIPVVSPMGVASALRETYNRSCGRSDPTRIRNW